MSGDAFTDALLIGSRLVWYAGILFAIGAAAVRAFVTSAIPTSPGIDRRVATVGLAGAALLIAAQLSRLHAQTYAYFGDDEPITLGLLLEVASSLPPWSTGWLAQTGTAVANVAAFGVVWAGIRAAWPAVYISAIAVAISVPLTGHAVAQEQWYWLPVALQSGHVLGAACWLGGLAVLVPTAILRSVRGGASPFALSALIVAFSPLALAGAALLTVTGVATAWLYLDRLSDLWMTGYGLTLSVKIAAVAGVAALGFVNWQYVRPRMRTDESGADRLSRTAGIELTLAAIVLALTAVLVGLPQPGH